MFKTDLVEITQNGLFTSFLHRQIVMRSLPFLIFLQMAFLANFTADVFAG